MTRLRAWLPWLGIPVALAVPLVTLPQLPEVSWQPLLLGLVPWVLGKYVACPLRWHAVSASGQSRRWHLRASAEGEFLGLFTPGHVGADLWRCRRLIGTGMGRTSAVADVALDRLVGAIGLIAFVLLAGVALPVRMMVAAVAVAGVALATALAVKRWRPGLLPRRPLPPPRRLAQGIALSVVYQLSTVALLLGVIGATGHTLSPLELIGAFGASQLAGAVPGPHGASPRDAALAVALVSLGLPWVAALAAVSLKAALAWGPALLLGGLSLLLIRRTGARVPAVA